MPPLPNDDRLLRDLATFARGEETRDAITLGEEWDLLASGVLAAGELEHLAAAASTSAEGRERYESFRPLGPAFEKRVTAGILDVLGESSGPVEVALGLQRGVRPVPLPPPPTPPVLRRIPQAPSIRRPLVRRLAWRGVAAAAALAGAFVFGPRLLVPPFPAYELALVPQGEPSQRSLSSNPATAGALAPALFHPGTSFEVAVRPLAPIESLHGDLEIACFLQDGARVLPWPSCAERAEIAPTRAVRIAGILGKNLAFEPGAWTLWIVLGRRGQIADFQHHPALLDGEIVAKRDWTALRVPRALRMVPVP